MKAPGSLYRILTQFCNVVNQFTQAPRPPTLIRTFQYGLKVNIRRRNIPFTPKIVPSTCIPITSLNNIILENFTVVSIQIINYPPIKTSHHKLASRQNANVMVSNTKRNMRSAYPSFLEDINHKRRKIPYSVFGAVSNYVIL